MFWFFNFIPAFLSPLPSLISHLMLNFTLSYLDHEHLTNITLPAPYTSVTTGHVSYSVPGNLQAQCMNATLQTTPYSCKKQIMLSTLKADSGIQLGNNPGLKARIVRLDVHGHSYARFCSCQVTLLSCYLHEATLISQTE